MNFLLIIINKCIILKLIVDLSMKRVISEIFSHDSLHAFVYLFVCNVSKHFEPILLMFDTLLFYYFC